MTMREWLDQISDQRYLDDDSNGLLVMDGFDDCIVGICHRFGDSFVVYDQQKVITKLTERDGMTEEEAREFHDFNQLGAWHGDRTPAFIEVPESIPDEETAE